MAASVSARPSANHDPGTIEIVAEVNTKDPADARESPRRHALGLERSRQFGVTQEEVDRARQKILKNRELAAADPNRIAVELSEWGARATGGSISSTATGSSR